MNMERRKHPAFAKWRKAFELAADNGYVRFH